MRPLTSLCTLTIVIGLLVAPMAGAQETDPEPPEGVDVEDPDAGHTDDESMTEVREPGPDAPDSPVVEPDESLEDRWHSEVMEEPQPSPGLGAVLFVAVLAIVLVGLLFWKARAK